MDEPTRNIFDCYPRPHTGIDELLTQEGKARSEQAWLFDYLNGLDPMLLSLYQKKAIARLKKSGVYFTISNQGQIEKRILPFDVIPRIIPASYWHKLKRGLEQRIVALNLFLQDIYSKQKILKNNPTLLEIVKTSPGFISKLQGFEPLNKNYLGVSGIDIILDNQGKLKVLEDNVKIPSGVSFALKNRIISKQLFSELFENHKIYPIESYCLKLRTLLEHLAYNSKGKVVVLSPGPYNAAYFEHCFLAQQMGARLVESQDLFVENNKVYLKEYKPNKKIRVKAIYRRIEENYLDPQFLKSDTLIGVKGLVKSYLSGNLVLLNALGNGVADDKAIYTFIPKIIQYYLSETPILDQVETYCCVSKIEKEYVLKNLEKLVIKSRQGSGGYDIVIGPVESKKKLEILKNKIKKQPNEYIAQPLIELSNHPTIVQGKLFPKRVDFRAFVQNGNDPWVLPGGLTRVALSPGSYIVNSSQGGGSKDTWIMEE